MATVEQSADWGLGGVSHAGPAGDGVVLLRGRLLGLSRLAFAFLLSATICLTVWNQLDAVRQAGGLWLAAFGDPDQARAAAMAGGVRLAAYIGLALLTVLQLLSYLGVALLLVRRSRELIAFLVAVFLLGNAGANFPPDIFAQLANQPLRAALGLMVDFCFALTFVVLFYVFPNGRFVPRWTAAAAAIWGLSLVWTFFIARELGGTDSALDLAEPLLLLGTTIGAQVYRYRRVSSTTERQQTKWFLGGLGLFLVTFVGGNVLLGVTGAFDPNATGPRVDLAWTIFEATTSVTALAVPLGLAVAVLRFRLFAIDVILNRALVYGGLTACIIGVYVFIVGYLGALFRIGSNPATSLVAAAVVAVLFQPLRLRIQRGANRLLYGDRDEPYAVLARLGRRLEGTLAPEAVLPTIVETVREALKLPYAAVALLQDDDLVTVAASGRPLPDSLQLPLVYQQERIGALLLAPRSGDAFDAADRRLLEDLARQAGVAAHAVRLTADLQRSRERLVTAREEERRRLRRDLHDGLGPMLGSLTLKLDVAGDLLERDPSAARALLHHLRGQAQTAIVDIRRLVYALRPPALDELGLVAALRAESAQYQTTGLHVRVEAAEVPATLPAAVEVAAYRIAQEALTNVVRHAAARSCVIRLTLGAETLELEILDDGRGLPPVRLPGVGVGFSSMRERAAELGGSCVVEPGPGGGTRVRVLLPLGDTAVPLPLVPDREG